MRQRFGAALLALVLALVAPAGAAKGFDCSTFNCCWRDYVGSLKDCRMSFGQIPVDESAAARKMREELMKGCITGARDMLESCRKSVTDRQRGLEPKKESQSLNGGYPLVVEGGLGGLADVFEFEVNVGAAEAGPWTLFLANGLPDLPGLDASEGSARASGIIEIDGHPVVGPAPLDERIFDLRIPLMLAEGVHVVRFTLTNADPVSSHAYVTVLLARQ